MKFTVVRGVLACAAALSPLVLGDGLPDMRILPLGDSITKGNGAKDGNGYRKRLRDKISDTSHFKVDMIGTLQSGSMPDNDHEGHSGEYLHQIAGYWQAPSKAQPNVVLVHAGTNNMDKELDLDKAPQLMESIIDGILEKLPDTVVLVAPVIWANDPRMQHNTDQFNQQLESIVTQRQNSGKHLLSVPISITKQDLWDKKHPNDIGYEKMAAAWYNAILDSHERGWLKAPKHVDADSLPGLGLGWGGSNSDGGGPSGCKGGNWKRVGSVFDDFRLWAPVNDAFTAPAGTNRSNIILADINNDGAADVMIVDSRGNVQAFVKVKESGTWTALGYIHPQWKDVTGDMVRMADVDNDGHADMIVVYSDGAAKVWKNTGGGKAFEAMDSKWATGLEARDKIRFQDMDGDGYADYVVLYDGGSVKWARNTHNNGKDPKKSNWEDVQTIAPGPAGEPSKSAHLFDINGDGKADYVIIRPDGSVRALLNTGNLNKEGNRRNWEDLGVIAPGVSGVTGSMITFADIDGDGRADFLAISEAGNIREWRNLGLVEKGVDNVRFADLNGDGKDDIIYINAQGMARAWLNQGIGLWKDVGVIAPGLKEDLSSARIEFADVNGDRLADYLVIYGGGAVKAFLNNGNIEVRPGGERVWRDAITIAPGVGEPGSKIRIQDLDGDGYADYLILYDGGSVKFYRNRHNIPAADGGGRIWDDGKVVATGAGEPGDKVQFADITGDGLAEYVIQYDGGAAKSMYNTGKIKGNDKARYWNNMGVIAAGVREQGPVRYADLDGDGKADYLTVYDDGKVSAWLNTCDWKPPKDGPPPDDGDGDNGGDHNNKCSVSDRVYSNTYMELGDIGLALEGGVKLVANGEGLAYYKQPVVIVNLTPHRFVKTGGPEPYQFKEWDFGDVPSGKARWNKVVFDNNIRIDFTTTNGYANYKIEGTDKTFQIHVTTHIPDNYEARVIFDLGGMGRGWRELGYPAYDSSVALVIWGSEEFGFHDSLQLGNAAWMKGMYDILKDRELRHVIMPGSHDAGMSSITKSGWWNGGIDSNTQTQSLDHYDQLVVGSRYFDMRIASVESGRFWVAHVNENLDANPFGATGASLPELITGVNRFAADHPGELIIWRIKYMTDLNVGKPSKDARYWDADKLTEFYDVLKNIDHRCLGLEDDDDFTKLPMRKFMDQNGGQGCVLLITAGDLRDGLPKDRPADGIYKDSHLPADDYWAKEAYAKDVAPKEVARLKTHPRDGQDKEDTFFIMQWQATGNDLRREAIFNSNPSLLHYGVNSMSPERFPTVILEDAIGVFHEGELKRESLDPILQTLVIGLNTYMVTQNCNISSVKFPLLGGGGGASGQRLAQEGDVFRGVVFANGTRLDDVPAGFCRTCTYGDDSTTLHAPNQVDGVNPSNGSSLVNGTRDQG